MMCRRLAFVRAVCGVVGLLASGAALCWIHSGTLTVSSRFALAPPPSVAESLRSAPLSPGNRWIVRVDGWSFQFDRIAAGRLPPSVASEKREESPASDYTSVYDPLIRRHAAAAGFDWRLISAMIYEESRFQPASESPRGAYGLMQIRDVAAQEVGAESYRTPEANIVAGIRYLAYLEGLFSEASPRDRPALMLAAYNIGPAHVQDAQRLAVRFGYDPLRWYGSLDRLLPLLERPAIYRALPNGYAQGAATVAYVGRVLDRYAHDPRLREE